MNAMILGLRNTGRGTSGGVFVGCLTCLMGLVGLVWLGVDELLTVTSKYNS